MNIEFHNIIGGIGVFLILISYLLIQIGKIKQSNIWYSAANFLGAALVLFSLYYEFNLSAFIIEVFWLLISLYGVIKYIKHRG